MIPKLTGNLLRAGRALAGFTRDDLAARTGLSRDVLRSWEVSSAAIIPAAIPDALPGLVNRIDVVCAYRRGHNFSMTLIRLSGLQFHAAGVVARKPGRVCRPVPSQHP